MRWTRWLTTLAFLLLLQVTAGPAVRAQGDAGLAQPISVASLGASELVVLESYGRLVVVSTETGKIRTLVRSFAPSRPIDMSTYTTNGETSIFITASRTAGKSDRALERHAVLQVGTSGKVVSRWDVRRPGYLSGVAAWPEEGALFVANSQTGEISRLRPGSGSGPAVWNALDGVYALGPLAVDAERRTLFAADPVQGALFAIDLDTKRARRIGDRLGQLLALQVDEASDRLYMADASGRRIWRLDLRDPDAKPTLFSESPRFRQPAGLAIAGGTLWVADRFAGKLFALSDDGTIVRELG